jgi:drug/metabolite transporter (DMT)-like permease
MSKLTKIRHPAGEKALKSSGTQQSQKSITWTGLLNLFAVYLVWGSTYLAIRVAVREGSGFPPFTMVGLRALAGGTLLLLWSASARMEIKPSRRELLILASSGILLWVGGNGLVSWAEQRADSSYAALLISAVPIWVALIEAILDWRAPSPLLAISLLVGFGGIVLLSFPVLTSGAKADLWSLVALLSAGLSWSLGTILQSRNQLTLTPRVSSGYQQVFAGLGFAILALLTREPLPTPLPEAWLAWGYLVLFGSVIAFTAYLQTLRLLPINVATTYAYVNPVIAVVLGWLILREPITPWTVAGAALVLIGVAGVFRARYTKPAPKTKAVAPSP